MARKKKRPRTLRRPELTVEKILAWADAEHARTGRWPTMDGGHVREDLNESWPRIDHALRNGYRGLPAGSSLARLLDRHRGVRNRKALPVLSQGQIVAWARAHRRRTGRWPTEDAGPIAGTRGEVWNNVAAALVQGIRGSPGGDTLARLLELHLGVPNPANRPGLSEQQILAWADAFHARTGRWPHADPAPIENAPGETWGAVDDALRASSSVRRTDDGSLISGAVSPDLGEDELERIHNLTNCYCEAEFYEIKVNPVVGPP
jgi:hypothetical protein